MALAQMRIDGLNSCKRWATTQISMALARMRIDGLTNCERRATTRVSMALARMRIDGLNSCERWAMTQISMALARTRINGFTVCKWWATAWISMALARMRIGTLTYCEWWATTLHASSTPETEQPELLQKCLKVVLPVCNGQDFTALINSSDIEIALNEYVCPGVENSFYGPFIRATNIALACLEEIKVDGMGAPALAVDMICQQNDMPMHQTHQSKKSTQKPDLVILPLDSACASFQDEKGGKKGKQKNKQKVEKDDGKNDEKNNEKRKKKCKAHMDTNAMTKPKNLLWKDVLACIEFKRKTLGRTKGIKSPPSLYTVTDYVPTKPEYLPVDHLQAEDPVPGLSQIPAARSPSNTASAVPSSGLTAAQPSKDRSSSKRKAADTLESAVKKSKMNPGVGHELALGSY
ncbi:uncharacterized protein HD556DRAFT_1494056 [Suillus plorans]|uniref:Uncharacterized protein n=1 Tax=Suillus plorans TaxID=116603 RepID=A0A9P7DSH4_9AGAM|nr:uncharacterized protein HD556DRAFT_1494056 [Suillus plorans]KAG1802087.1 hypothetical protein HD556DRAFT_1494056 [Suillus plorans]